MSARLFRIAHLSDLHAVSDDGPRHFGQKRVIEALITDLEAKAEEQPFDLLVFSGDLSNDGTPAALQRGRSLLLDPLRSLFPDLPILLVPGNHDVDRQHIDSALDVGLRETLKSREDVQTRLQDSEKAKQARERLSAWDELRRDWPSGLPPTEIAPFAYSYRLEKEGVDVAIGAFDTAWRSGSGSDEKGNLLLGVDHLRTFIDDTTDTDLLIATFHHPPDWLTAFDGDAVRTALEQAGALVLTGHNHTADPKIEITTRGTALYCQGTCAYDRPEYANGYGLIDVDVDQKNTRVTLRRWNPKADQFVPDVDSASEGVFLTSWPTERREQPVVYQLSQPEVLKPLAHIAQEHSVLADHMDSAVSPSVSEFVVPPRFWPVPHTEAFDRSVAKSERPKQVDPLDQLDDVRALIVAGPKVSGVTTALLWIVERHYRNKGTHVPAYVRTDRRFSRRRIQQAIDQAKACVREEASAGREPRVLLAVDDVNPADSKALGRLIAILRENPTVTMVLGCHDQVHEVVARALEEHDLSSRRVYLGPFGRRETRLLVARIAGPNGTELVQKVLDVVQRQQLPRNPLNLAALVSVITREPNLTAINESGLLQSYVRVLLDNPLTVDPEGLNMDYRRRENLLERIAQYVVETSQTRLPRSDIEKLVLEYYDEIGWRSGSAGQLIDSLVRRRVLAADDRGVGFRYPALLHLFAAKAADDSEEFRDRIFDDVLLYAPIIQHIAGLKRNDRQTVERVRKVAEGRREHLAGAVQVEQFDLIKDRDGWSRINSLEDVKRLLRPRPDPPSEEELDEIYDEMANEPEEAVEVEPFDAPLEEDALGQLLAVYGLLGSVLQNSELLPDVAFRAAVMRDVISGWGVMTVLMAVEEDTSRELQLALAPLFGQVEDAEKLKSMTEHLARLLVLTLMSIGLYIEAGSVHQKAVLEDVLKDDLFMERSANALFASMLYAMLEFADWPSKLGACIEKHGEHPMVRQIIRQWCLREYRGNGLSPADNKAVEDLLVRILIPDPAEGGPTAVAARSRQASEVRDRLQRSKVETRWAEAEGGSFGEIEEGSQ